MDESVARAIMQIASFSVILPAILSLVRWRNGDREQRLLSILIGISVLIEFAAIFVGSGLHLNNLFLLHFFTILEFTLLVLIFAPSIKKSIPLPLIKVLIGMFALFAIFNSIYIDGIQKFNAFARAVEGILIIALVLVYFYTILKSLEIKYLEWSPLFWIATGSLIYFSGSLFVFIYSNQITASVASSFTVWGIHAFMSIVLNIFYAIALWIKPIK